MLLEELMCFPVHLIPPDEEEMKEPEGNPQPGDLLTYSGHHLDPQCKTSLSKGDPITDQGNDSPPETTEYKFGIDDITLTEKEEVQA
jgi:hypothetical protein